MFTLNDFRQIGREQRHRTRNPLIWIFTWLFGPIGIHSRIRAGHALKAIAQLELPEEAAILDAGSGRGLVLFLLAKHYPRYRLHGIEIDPETVTSARAIAKHLQLSNLTFELGDLKTCSIPTYAYDLVFSIDVLEHIVDDVAVLRRLHQALKPNGYLVLHLPLRHQDQRRIFAAFRRHTIDDHVRDEYTWDEIRVKLEATGFQVKSLTYGFGPSGELAFELNWLFWNMFPLRAALAVLMYPASWWCAYRDVKSNHERGNSMIITAQRLED